MTTGIGDALRAARRERGHSLADAARDTRVRETYLAALEQEEFDGLGGDVYVKGFLTSYAKFLGIDPAPLLDTYRAQVLEAQERRARESGSAGEPRVRLRRPPGAVVVVALLVLLMLILIGLGLGDRGVAGLGALA